MVFSKNYTSSQLNANDGRLALIDLLRFVAAMIVVSFHFSFRGPKGDFMSALQLPSALVYTSQYGYLGVSLFFMISGFVIAYSAEGRTAMAFGISRFIRLYPSFLVCMTITFAVLNFFPVAVFPISVKQYLANLLLFSKILHQPMMDGVYWSIYYEVIFYGWVFLLLLAGAFKKWQHSILLVWLIISILNFAVLRSEFLKLIFITDYAYFFIIGILAYRMRNGDSSLRTLGILAVSSGFALYTADIEAGLLTVSFATPYSALTAMSFLLAAIVVFISTALYKGSVPLQEYFIFLGALTYPLYLLHQMIGYAFIGLFYGKLPDQILLLMVVAFVLGLAFLVNRYFEKPVLPRIRKLLIHLLERPSAQRRTS